MGQRVNDNKNLLVFITVPMQHCVLIADQIVDAVCFGSEDSDAFATTVTGKGLAVRELDCPKDSSPSFP